MATTPEDTASAATLQGNGTNQATWSFSNIHFPDGYYTATLPASAGLATTHSTLFHVLAGDSSGNATVEFSDFGQVAAAFNTIAGPVYRPGDLNGDGNVDFGDFGVLANGFNNLLSSLSLDFGDAAAPFPTVLPDGARHILGSGLFLGAGVDAESNGTPDVNAAGDDNAGDDEDGVTFAALQAGTNAGVTVTATVPVTAVLNAWIDFNADGDWDDSGEQVFVDQALAGGVNNLSVAIPSGAAGPPLARFRVTRTPGYSYFGLASDGEVEDYQVSIVAASSSRSGWSASLDLWAAAFVPEPVGQQTALVGPKHQVRDSVGSVVAPNATHIVAAVRTDTASTELTPAKTEGHGSLDEQIVDRVFEIEEMLKTEML